MVCAIARLKKHRVRATSLYCLLMKLQQGQVWKKDKEYIRIVRLERLEVEYKSMSSLAGKDGTKHVTSKKDFCRLLKQARLLAPAKNPTPWSMIV
jgi:hypothetical protein